MISSIIAEKILREITSIINYFCKRLYFSKTFGGLIFRRRGDVFLGRLKNSEMVSFLIGGKAWKVLKGFCKQKKKKTLLLIDFLLFVDYLFLFFVDCLISFAHYFLFFIWWLLVDYLLLFVSPLFVTQNWGKCRRWYYLLFFFLKV